MKTIKKPKPIKKIITIGVIAASVIGLLAAGWLLYRHFYSATSTTPHTSAPTTQTINYGPATQQEKQESTNQKQQVINENPSPSPAPGPNQLPTNESLGVTISRANQTAAGQPLNIRTVVNGTATGTCIITLTKSGQPTVSHNFSITTSATYATCDQADIPASDFSISGSWQLSITIKTSSAESQPLITTVSIAK